jgi:hypothetical protein
VYFDEKLGSKFSLELGVDLCRIDGTVYYDLPIELQILRKGSSRTFSCCRYEKEVHEQTDCGLKNQGNACE